MGSCPNEERIFQDTCFEASWSMHQVLSMATRMVVDWTHF